MFALFVMSIWLAFKSKKGKKGAPSISEEEPQITFDINEMKENMNLLSEEAPGVPIVA